MEFWLIGLIIIILNIYEWNEFKFVSSRLIILRETKFLSNFSFYQQRCSNKWNPLAGKKLFIYSIPYHSRSMFVRFAFDKKKEIGIGGSEIMMVSVVADYLGTSAIFKCLNQTPFIFPHSVYQQFFQSF